MNTTTRIDGRRSWVALAGLVAAVATAACGASYGSKAPSEPAMMAKDASGHFVSASAGRAAADSPMNTEAYDHIAENDFFRAADRPLSTFSIDVDTASYSNVRRFLRDGSLPPPDAVRIEELINYFPYDYPDPAGAEPFAAAAEVIGCPWAPRHRLLRIGLQGKRMHAAETPPRNLVFLLDVSGSMEDPRKLPLLRSAFTLLTEQLRPSDTVAIVVYAGASGLVLPPTAGSDRATIIGALQRLQAGGSTNGGEGIQLAYQMARKSFKPGGINRVILATDGDFNVGVTSQGDLIRLIEQERETGVFLTVLGLGTGNLKDSTMEKLADKGNGNYAYLDTLSEARKVLVEQAGSTLVTIAKDVKIQVEFNPATVEGYRLVGYENRLMRSEDFNDDEKDAGEIGAGHSVTALYEVVPAGVPLPQAGSVDPLKYQQPATVSPAAASGELGTIKVRYKEPAGTTSKLSTFAVSDRGTTFEAATADARFAAAVAAFGMLLRDSKHKGGATFAMARDVASSALGTDANGYRRELVALIDRAHRLKPDAKPTVVAR
ncbi:MAG: VWA domain-containing protein [Deltaproteobacteria bacterium]|nr:VWA domain-containing protein [Deltaproteobacteria bacterium]MBW2530910.1 VWA domain-containing protein [Deltaproteobacteria bacterium]